MTYHRRSALLGLAGLVAATVGATLVLATPAAADSTATSLSTPSPTSTPSPPPPAVVVAHSGGCVSGHTVAELSISGAVPGAQYALYGTSGYVASDPFTAHSAQFSLAVPIGHGYLGLTGDVEARALRQVSNQFTIADACPRYTVGPPDPPGSPRPSSTPVTRTTPRQTPSTHSASPVQLVTHTDVLTDVPSTSTAATSTAVAAPQLLSPAAATRHASHTGEDVVIALIAALLVGGILTAATRRGRR